MMYAPHILQKRIPAEYSRDEYGRSIVAEGERWEMICACRCDDNTTQHFTTSTGEVFRPAYHVVMGGKVDIKAGDYVRAMDGDNVRGQGEVSMVKKANYFDYTELWM